ncbi:MAG: hypothetical protein ABIB71_05825 [Candidatus Woesearchaeota archaeon]
MLLSELDFGSYLAYTPRGKSDIAKKAKNIVLNLKNERSIALESQDSRIRLYTLKEPNKAVKELVPEN